MNTIEAKIDDLLKKVPQFTRLKRHLYTLLVHSTPRKIWNLLRIELQRKVRSVRVRGWPYIIIVDPVNTCNLKCPLCPTGLKETGMTRGRLTFDEFKKSVGRFIPYAYEVILHNWGEPFLNKDILRMVRYCKDHNIGTNLSTNLNILPFSGEDLVRSGLEYLIVSLDGTSQEVYQQYRVNGNIDTVIANLKEIITAKKKLKSKTPVIEWQYLVMKHNLDEIAAAKKLSKEFGVDLLRFIPVGLPFDIKDKQGLMEKWYPYVPENKKDGYIEDRFLQKPITGGCFYLYRSATVTAKGKVTPCCAVWKDADCFGDMLGDEDFQQIWNGSDYMASRALFSGRECKKGTPMACCVRCNLFEKS